MKAIGFNQGQYGDLCINLVACKAFKRDFPNSKLYFGINKKYQSIKDIFSFNDLIDDIYIWDSYNEWPSQNDINYIEDQKFDLVFNPMPKHSKENWYIDYHQTQEVCLMQGLEPPENLQINLNKYFKTERNKKFVAVNLFAETSSHAPKVPNLEKSREYCELLKMKGYIPVQVGLETEPEICENRFVGNFFETIQFALSCDFVFTVDSALAWIMSGYQHSVLGIYNYKYYYGAETAKNWQPINPNAYYIESDNINIDNNNNNNNDDNDNLNVYILR